MRFLIRSTASIGVAVIVMFKIRIFCNSCKRIMYFPLKVCQKLSQLEFVEGNTHNTEYYLHSLSLKVFPEPGWLESSNHHCKFRSNGTSSHNPLSYSFCLCSNRNYNRQTYDLTNPVTTQRTHVERDNEIRQVWLPTGTGPQEVLVHNEPVYKATKLTVNVLALH
jgi:hypothetical protein